MNKGFWIGVLAVAAASAVFAAAEAQSPAPAPPAGDPGEALVANDCVTCHTLSVITAHGRSAQAWSDVVDKMAGYGVEATDAELTQIKAYLAKTLPETATPPAAPAGAAAPAAPAAPTTPVAPAAPTP